MPVYVDNINRMCSDTDEEFAEMIEAIGANPSDIIAPGRIIERIVLDNTLRKRAIAFGAVQITREHFMRIMQRRFDRFVAHWPNNIYKYVY